MIFLLKKNIGGANFLWRFMSVCWSVWHNFLKVTLPCSHRGPCSSLEIVNIYYCFKFCYTFITRDNPLSFVRPSFIPVTSMVAKNKCLKVTTRIEKQTLEPVIFVFSPSGAWNHRCPLPVRLVQKKIQSVSKQGHFSIYLDSWAAKQQPVHFTLREVQIYYNLQLLLYICR